MHRGACFCQGTGLHTAVALRLLHFAYTQCPMCCWRSDTFAQPAQQFSWTGCKQETGNVVQHTLPTASSGELSACQWDFNLCHTTLHITSDGQGSSQQEHGTQQPQHYAATEMQILGDTTGGKLCATALK